MKEHNMELVRQLQNSSNKQDNGEQLEATRRERDEARSRGDGLAEELSELSEQVETLHSEAGDSRQALQEEQQRKARLEGQTIHLLGLIELDRLQSELETCIGTHLRTLKHCVSTKEQKLRDGGGNQGGNAMEKLLDELKCPLTHELFNDPVIAADGFSYEKVAIESWIRENGNTSPMTSKEMQHSFLVPNHVVKSMVSIDHLGIDGNDSHWHNDEDTFYG